MFIEAYLQLLVLTATLVSAQSSFNDKAVRVQNVEAAPVTTAFQLAPRRQPGDVVGGSHSKRGSENHHYRLTEFVRVQGDKRTAELNRVDPVFFTPAIAEDWGAEHELLSDGAQPIATRGVTVDAPLALPPDLHGTWRLQKRTNRGAHGEIWRGTKVMLGGTWGGQDSRKSSDEVVYILKRILLEKGQAVRLAGEREIFFGEMCSSDRTFDHHVARFIDSFTTQGAQGERSDSSSGPEELWLVFVDEGLSLHEWLYTAYDLEEGSAGATMLLPSEAWRRLREDDAAGRSLIQEVHPRRGSLVWQLLSFLRVILSSRGL